MKNNLVIKGHNNCNFVFRKQKNRPIEMKQTHETLGDLNGWQVAKNFCLSALITDDALAKYFGITAWQFRYGSN